MFKKLSSIITKFKNTGIVHLFGSSVINKVLGFVSSFILVRLIPKADYGVYSNADNIISMFCIFEGLGMTTTWLQFGCTKTGKEKENTWSFCFYFSIFFQVILCVVIALTGRFIHFGIQGTGKMLIYMSFLPLFRLISEMQRIYMRTEMMNKEYAHVNTVSAIITVMLSISFSILLLANGLILSGYFVSIVTILFISLKYKIKLPKHKNNLQSSEKKELIKFSLVCTINNSTSSLMYILDTFILGIVIAQSTVTASYKVASKIPVALAFIPACLMIYIYPYFAKHSNDKRWCKKNFRRVVLGMGAFNFSLVAVFILFASPIIKLIFGAKYLDAVPAFRILCLNYAVQSTFRNIPGQLLITQKKLGFNTLTGVVSGLLNTSLNILLIPRFSSNGAAMATLIVSALVGLANMIYITKVFNNIKEPENS